MASQLERSVVGVFQTGLKLTSPASSSSFRVQRRQCYESEGLRYLDTGGPTQFRNPNDPRRAKLPEGPKLGVDSTERVPYTYGGKVRPHYHVFRQLWPEPTLLKRKFGPKADPTKTSKSLDHVEVPMRKARSSTAVLEALASTVQIESNSVPHDLLDDPYLLPAQHYHVQDYRQAKASGRRIAKRIAEDLPYFFDLKFFRPDPIIKSLESGASDWEFVINEEGPTQFNDLIKERLVAGRHDLAFSAYEASLEQNAQLSPGVLASLFEIAAFHNLATDADFDTLRPSEIQETEELNTARDRETIRSAVRNINSSREDLWDPSGIAEDLWRRLPKTDALHCVMVQALVRHGAAQRAYDHFTTMIEEGKVVDLPTFNSLLTWHNEIDAESQHVRAESDKADPVYKNILRVMAERRVRPTTGTFNAILHGLRDQRLDFRRDQAEAVLVEMIDLRLRPTLGTLGLMTAVWRSSSYILKQLDWLLRIAENGVVDAGSEDDYDELFFLTAIHAVQRDDDRFSPEIPELIRRMHNLVTTNPSCRAAAARKYEYFHVFVRESMRALVLNGQVDDAMRVFSNYVPYYFSPQKVDWIMIMTAMTGAAPIPVRHVITLGNEFCSPLAYDQRSSESADAFTSLLNPGIAENSSELIALVTVAANYFRGYQRVQEVQTMKNQKFEYSVYGPEAPGGRDTVRLSGYAYGNLLFVLSNAERLDDAIDLFVHYMKEVDQIRGSPPVEGVALLMRRVAKSPDLSNSKKARVMVDALKFLDRVGAKRHLVEGLDLMVEEVTLDATSALIVTQLKKQVGAKETSPSRDVQN